MRTIVNLLKDRSAASAAEYAMILAIIGTALAIASIFLGQVIATAMSEAASCIQTSGSSC